MRIQHQKSSKKTAVAIFYRRRIQNHRLLQVMLILIMFALIVALANAEQKALQITVYKSPTCGCCSKWVKHLEANGFKVEAHNSKDMRLIKQKIGVDSQYQSCHTALIGGYFIEGHVPAQDIKRLLAEKPDATGLSVPRMPMGTPGMEGHRKDPYSVLLIKKAGDAKIYSNY